MTKTKTAKAGRYYANLPCPSCDGERIMWVWSYTGDCHVTADCRTCHGTGKAVSS